MSDKNTLKAFILFLEFGFAEKIQTNANQAGFAYFLKVRQVWIANPLERNIKKNTNEYAQRQGFAHF